ncbi:hypothetical protein [Xylophilus sp.]|uniref:hypothetical protein n=1 Tax=Xylophilus sp. TaxID=2653893 RepID=UPI0013BDA146|nr:hypothetical protein [Xylophilus sp.]KAF1049113.1 MAG: Acireductone dioxygenase [Xylophilus sp.]
MAALVHFDEAGQWGETLVCEQPIRAALQRYGLACGRWPLRDLGDGSIDAVRAAYHGELDGLGLAVRSVDRVQLRPDHAGWPELRQKFIAEHTHDDAEVRYFLDGAGIFYIRVDGGFLALLCEAGDWVAVPAGTRHFFDAGEAPSFDALRIFTAPEGWVARPTGAEAPPLPLFDEFVAGLLELTGHAEPACDL